MKAIDTNILVRLFTRDDTEQHRKAAAIVGDGPVLVARTVLLEVEWVLRSVARFDDERIAGLFRGLTGLGNVHFDDDACVLGALSAFESGLDFADALHLGSARACEVFVTFDRSFIRRAAAIKASPAVVSP